MSENYIIKELEIKQLYVNPDNARFINPDELADEIAAINQLVKMNDTHILNLSYDVALNGLNPNELPIVIPDPDDDNIYLVIDGNRRITSIKLMTQYKNDLDKINVNPSAKKTLQALQCNIKTVMCVVYENEDQVSELIEKLHTSKPGVSQVKWDPQAQDRHQYRNGVLTKRLAIIEILRFSTYTSPEAKDILYQRGWVSKLQRFVRNDCLTFFGIGFDENINIILYLEEPEVIKGLSQLTVDLKNRFASEVAQTANARQKYLRQFPHDKIPDAKKTNNPPVVFDVKNKRFMAYNAKDGVAMSNKGDGSNNVKDLNNDFDEVKNRRGANDKQKNDVKCKPTDIKADGDNQGNDLKGESVKDKQPPGSRNGKTPTKERTSLIPREENIPIKNQRTRDLYEELKIINVGSYKNVVSIAFRSLVEFSINCFLEYKLNKWAYNPKITLFEKLEKVIGILEGVYTKPKLQQKLPAIYGSINSYKSKKADLNSIPHLHILIHSHNYHPTDKELKALYNNYSPLLEIIWKNIKQT